MKWRLYQFSCLYNIIACLGFTAVIAVFMFDEGGLDISILFILLAVAIPVSKNMMGYHLFRIRDKQKKHSDLFGAGFYFLWFFNFVITFFLVYAIIADYREDMENLSGRSIEYHIFIWGRILLAICSVYTLPFDIILERKISRKKILTE